MSKPGDQHGRVTPTPALSQKVKASAQLGKHGLDSKRNYRSSGGVLSVHFWKANCMGNSGRCHWAATSLLKLKLHRVHHHRALKSFLWALNPVVSILEQRAAGVSGLGISPRFGEQLPNWKNNYMGFFFFFPFFSYSAIILNSSQNRRPASSVRWVPFGLHSAWLCWTWWEGQLSPTSQAAQSGSDPTSCRPLKPQMCTGLALQLDSGWM